MYRIERKHMKKLYISVIVLVILSMGIGVIVYNSKKNNDDYSFYYIDFVAGERRIVKYSNYMDKVEPVFVYEEGINGIYDIYSDEQMLIDGNFDVFFDVEYNNGEITNLNEIFDMNEPVPNIKYIKGNSDIAYQKDQSILVYHKDTKEVETVFELEEGKTRNIDNFDFSYDGKTLYYTYIGTVYAYNIETKTNQMIVNGKIMLDISQDGNSILHTRDNILYIYNVETGENKEIDRKGWRRKLYPAIFNEDGTKVLYAKYAIEPTHVWFYVYDVETGKTKMVRKVANALPCYGW